MGLALSSVVLRFSFWVTFMVRGSVKVIKVAILYYSRRHKHVKIINEVVRGRAVFVLD